MKNAEFFMHSAGVNRVEFEAVGALRKQQHDAARLDVAIEANLRELGYGG